MRSSSPSTKRSLKPSSIAPSHQQHTLYSAPTELPNLKPAAPLGTVDQDSYVAVQQPVVSPTNRKRKSESLGQPPEHMASSAASADAPASSAPAAPTADVDAGAQEPKAKKSRTNTPWTPAEELRLKQMRDTGNSWSEIAKVGLRQR